MPCIAVILPRSLMPSFQVSNGLASLRGGDGRLWLYEALVFRWLTSALCHCRKRRTGPRTLAHLQEDLPALDRHKVIALVPLCRLCAGTSDRCPTEKQAFNRRSNGVMFKPCLWHHDPGCLATQAKIYCHRMLQPASWKGHFQQRASTCKD